MGLDWAAAIAALDDTEADVSYEEIECVGLDETLPERLVATFRIKRPLGYSGDLCYPGSQEYVAFWADWNNTCQWTYLGTTAVNVHDIKNIPKEGLCYSAILPVDLTYERRSCEKPKIGRVRAVPSWAVPPSTTNPDQLTYGGNRLDAHVQINPGDAITNPLAKIRNIGGIAVEDIFTSGVGMTKPTAVFAHNPPLSADGWGLGRTCPFGEPSIIASSLWYRIQLDNTGPLGPPASPLTMDIHITSGAGDCKDFVQGGKIDGYFIADDLHFGGWGLSTEPNSFTTPSNQPTVTGLAPTDPAPAPGGHAWHLDTGSPVAMKPCGYVVQLDVSDRTIMHSVPFAHNSNHIEVGFCLREA